MDKIWTKISGDEAAQQRVDQPWGSLTWLASKAIAGCEGVTVGRVAIRAGANNPPHSHSNCEEVLHLLAGRLEHWMGDEAVILEPGDTLAVAAGVPHHARSIGDVDADMIVAYSAGQRDFRKEH